MKTYPAKALLFGEYTVILGSKALAIPVNQYFGYWNYHPEVNPTHHLLSSLYSYLLESPIEFSKYIDLAHFKKELDSGLYFESTIPHGYGIGSSGALCAALFDHFKRPEYIEMNQLQLQSLLAQIENYFHGLSSGLDPLVSYLQKPIVIHTPGEQRILDTGEYNKSLSIYLADSGFSRKTEPLVEHFRVLLSDPTFKNALEEEIKPLVNKCIDQWISKEAAVFDSIKLLSRLQFKYFKDFIPENIIQLWNETEADVDLAMKLCGAGGGGYFLMFARKEVSVDFGIPLTKIEY